MASALRKVLLWALFCCCALAQSPLDRAVALARQKHYSEANKILQGVPEPSQVSQRIAFHRLEAAIASGLNDNATAAQDMRAALELAPNDPGLLLATAVAELQAGLLDGALRHADQAGDNSMAHALVAEVQDRRGDHRKAASAYRAAVALAPQREDYRIALGLELMQQPDFRPAIEMLQKAVPLFPNSAKLRTLLGIAEYVAGYNNEAIAALADAISIDPKLDSAYRCLTQIVLQSSTAPPASVVDSLCSWNQVVCSALKLRIARETHDTALDAQAIAGLKLAPPGDVVGTCELARAYEWNGELSKARAQMEECVRLDPSPQNHYRLGLLYEKLGLSELAHKEIELRTQTLQRMSEETAMWLKALQASETSSKRSVRP